MEASPVLKRKDVVDFYARLAKERPGLLERMKADGIPEKKIEEEAALVMLEVCAAYAKKNFWFFVTEILDWEGLDEEFHGGMCDFMQKKGEAKLLLSPRGHLKSTVCTVAYALWRSVRVPDARILIANYKLDTAKSFLFQIRNELGRERFKAFYPKLAPNLKNVKWNETQITLNRSSNPKEATFEVTGVGGEITGKHYDVILFDDIQGPENVGTLEQLTKLKNWWNQMQAILEPGGDQVLVGTRWHYADIYGFIIQNLQNEFQILQTDVFKADGVTPVWPRKFTPEVLKKIEERMSSDPKSGRALWLAQYRNTIIDEQTAAFKRGKFRYFVEKDLPTALGLTISVDPAISDKESADRSAITVRGVDEAHNWWVLEAWGARGVTPGELVDKIFEIYLKWSARFPVNGVGIESIAYQKSLIFAMRDEMQKRDVWMPMIELGNWRASKELRIRGLVPRFDQGGLFFRNPMESGDQTALLIDEMMQFPKSPHEDLLDSLAMHSSMETVPGVLTPTERDDDAAPAGRDRYGYPVAESTGMTYGSFL